jgi:hypothetical protein
MIFPFHTPKSSISKPRRAMSRVETYIAYSGCTLLGAGIFFCFVTA